MENTLQYKGYFTNISFSASDKVLHGKIEGIDDLITFESESIANIEKEFHDAVDDYLAFCEEMGKDPSKTYRGTFNVRIDPELHRAIAINAAKNGMSLNQAVETAIHQYVFPKEAFMDEMYMKSIEHHLSEINGALGQLSTSNHTTGLTSNYSHMTMTLPQIFDGWNRGN